MTEYRDETVWMTVTQTLEYLKISKTTLYQWMSTGRLPFYYISGTRQRRFKQQDLVHVDPDQWLSVAQSLAYLHVSKTTLYSLMKKGRLPYTYAKGTRQRLISRRDLDAVMIPGKSDDLEHDDSDTSSVQ